MSPRTGIGGVGFEPTKSHGHLIYSQIALPTCISTSNRHLTVSSNIYRAVRCTMRFQVSQHTTTTANLGAAILSSSNRWSFYSLC